MVFVLISAVVFLVKENTAYTKPSFSEITPSPQPISSVITNVISGDMYSCTTSADCTVTTAGGCCPIVALNKKYLDEFSKNHPNNPACQKDPCFSKGAECVQGRCGVRH